MGLNEFVHQSNWCYLGVYIDTFFVYNNYWVQKHSRDDIPSIWILKIICTKGTRQLQINKFLSNWSYLPNKQHKEKEKSQSWQPLCSYPYQHFWEIK